MRLLVIVSIFCLNCWSATAETIATSAGPVVIEKMLGGLDEPWALAFLPGGGFLVTERSGSLIMAGPDGTVSRISGTPKVVARGQGGLLDVMVPRDFAESRDIFFSFSKRQWLGAGTALAVATLSPTDQRLTNLRVIFEMSAGSSGGRHFGSRIVEARDGSIFLTMGERGERPAAQDLSRHNGSVIRILRDGSVPVDNPFFNQNSALPEIWSYGHRNPQGAALDLKGNLWVSEHGAKGGDEINRITAGENYGWPVIAYGRHYSGAKIGEGTAKPGLQQPAHYWDPSIAPSGLMIYSGKLWPQWRGSFFVGSLKFDYLSRLDPEAGWTEEKIASNETIRVRDVREAPDGSIWFISVGQGAVYRMAPAN
ncbi:MAG: PQQ-dependent sugar dehydrogenase [Paracoccaceae bacterium]